MARRRRPMSAATKAKISAAQKGNKNAYKGGPKKKPSGGQLGGRRGKDGVKQIRNKGYGKRRAVLNLAGAAAVGVLGYNAARGAGSKHFTRSGKRGNNTRASVAVGGGAAALLASRVHRSHKLGMAKRKAKKQGVSLAVEKRRGKVNIYNPVPTRRQKRKAAKGRSNVVPLQPRKSGKRRAA